MEMKMIKMNLYFTVLVVVLLLCSGVVFADYTGAEASHDILYTDQIDAKSGGDIVVNPGAGNVGIGNDDPQSKLTISTDDNLQSIKWLMGLAPNSYPGDGGGFGTGIKLHTTEEIDPNGLNNRWAGIASVSGGSFGQKASMVFYTGSWETGDDSLERMRITGDGNVGIGTDDPHTLLGIQKDFNAIGGSGWVIPLVSIVNHDIVSTNPHAALLLSTTGGAGDPSIEFDIYGENGYAMGIDNSDGDKFKISGDIHGVDVNTLFTIDKLNGGNVGLGISSPSKRLDISVGGGQGIKLNRLFIGNVQDLGWTEQIMQNVMPNSTNPKLVNMISTGSWGGRASVLSLDGRNLAFRTYWKGDNGNKVTDLNISRDFRVPFRINGETGSVIMYGDVFLKGGAANCADAGHKLYTDAGGKILCGTDASGLGGVPDLDASKITSGTLAAARIPDLAATKITSGTLAAARIPNLAASKITSGTLAADRIPNIPGDKIPNLAASKITSGTLAADRIPNLAASKITSGTLAADRIPNLAASKITSGTLATARIPSITSSKITDGTIAVGDLSTAVEDRLLPVDVPGVPTSLTHSISGSTVTLDWNVINAASHYNVYLQKNGITAERIIDEWTMASDYSISSLERGKYSFWIRTWNAYGYSDGWSSEHTFFYNIPNPIAPAGSGHATGVKTFTWEPVATSTWYELYIRKLGSSGWRWCSDESDIDSRNPCNYVDVSNSGYIELWSQTTSVIPKTSSGVNWDVPAGTYEWWVRAWGPWGAQGQTIPDVIWSDGESFTVA